MNELIDVLDEKGKPTGKTVLKSYAHRMGIFHATVHIWLYTSDGHVLVQQRGKRKKTFPLFWDVSVAGHVASGEAIELSAIRETKEEIGLIITTSDLEKIGVFKAVQKHNGRLIDCEFHHTYISELKKPIASLKKQKGEVGQLRLISVEQFVKEALSIANNSFYVPHGSAYYKTIIREIKKKL